MDGLFNIHKPSGISSAKCVYRIRKWTGIKKSGHAGTLDPAAAGVLLVCQGKATKLVERLMDLPKTYVAAARLDVTSDSFDAERPFIPVDVPTIPTRDDLDRTAQTFVGQIMQAPPAFSAIKVAGRPAYKSAAKGKPLNLKPRPVQVYAFDVLDYAWPEVTFKIDCGRGTYIRSLIRDWGDALSAGGCLTALTRTGVGPFRTDTAIALENLDEHDPANTIIAIETVLTLIEAAQYDNASP
jgi:tRNA pseudouridine55 synthase